jgi:hypothetical protein
MQGLKAENQVPIHVSYKENVVGEYLADIVVENQVILELKSVERLQKVHEAQLLNYLKATSYSVGLLINFRHPKAEIKRYILRVVRPGSYFLSRSDYNLVCVCLCVSVWVCGEKIFELNRMWYYLWVFGVGSKEDLLSIIKTSQDQNPLRFRWHTGNLFFNNLRSLFS